MNVQYSGGSRSFAKETRALKMRRVVAGHWKLTTTNWEQSSKLILLQLHEKKNNSILTILCRVMWHLKQIGRVKRLDKWVPHELTANQKNQHFEVSSSLILCNNKPFLDWIVMCDEKCVLYEKQQWPTQWLDREEAPKHFPKPNLHQKKVMVIAGWSAACLTHYSFLNPSKTITSEKQAQQINEMHQKLQCLQPALVNRIAQFFFTTTLNCNQHFKSWMNWAAKFCLICHSSSISTTFCFPRVHWILTHRFLCNRNKQTYFSLAKMCYL